MKRQRILLAAAACAVAAGAFAVAVLWRAGRALNTARQSVAAEAVIRARDIPLQRVAPAGFQPVSAPASFRDAALFRGRLAIAGSSGLVEYDPDGRQTARYDLGTDLPPAPLNALALDRSGSDTENLWIATDGQGALVYDGRAFRQILPDEPRYRKIAAILPVPGRVLLGTRDAGLIAWDGKQLTPYHSSLAALKISALAGDEADLWIGTIDAGAVRWRAGQLDRIDESNGLPDRQVLAIAAAGPVTYIATPLGVAEVRDGRVQRTLAPGFTVQAVLPEQGRLLAGTLDEGAWTIPLAVRPGALPVRERSCNDCSIRRFLRNGSDVLAVADGAVYRARPDRAEWESLVQRDPAALTDRNIAALAADNTGRLWIGYFDRGLDILEMGGSGAVRHIEDQQVFCVNRIVHDPARGRSAVATANGLVLFDAAGEKRQSIGKAQGLIANHVTDLVLRPDGSWVAATPSGVSFIDASGVSSVYAFHGLVNNHVYALAANGSRIAAGTLGGLSFIDSGSVAASFTNANSGLRHNWISAIVRANEAWFIGTYGAGVLQLDDRGAWTAFADLPRSFEVNPNAMAVTPRAVYAGTLGRGLAVYSRSAARWNWITLGLPSLNVTAVEAAGGMVYIGTDNGLVRAPEGSLVP